MHSNFPSLQIIFFKIFFCFYCRFYCFKASENAWSTIYNTTFIYNRALSHGGAISLSGDRKLQVFDSFFHQNIARDGGAISLESASRVNVKNSLFYRNVANRDGGALHVENQGCYVELCTVVVRENVAHRHGGGGLFQESGVLKMHDTVFEKNVAVRGGAIFFFSMRQLLASIQFALPGPVSTIFQNTDTDFSCHTNVSNAHFLNNVAKSSGGVAYWGYFKPGCPYFCLASHDEINHNQCVMQENLALYGSDLASDVNTIELLHWKRIKKDTRFFADHNDQNVYRDYKLILYPGEDFEIAFTPLDYFNNTVLAYDDTIQLILERITRDGQKIDMENMHGWFFFFFFH